MGMEGRPIIYVTSMVLLFFPGGLIAITCSTGLMLHARLPKLRCIVYIAYHRWVEFNWFAGQQWHVRQPELGIVPCGLSCAAT